MCQYWKQKFMIQCFLQQTIMRPHDRILKEEIESNTLKLEVRYSY